MRDESEKEVIHRLEAFSDVVIGFSLAQLALTLTIPEKTSIFLHVRGVTPILGFVITFVLICAIWWAHHRLFRHLFVPTPVNIVLNFASLGGVVFLAYSVQVLVHFHMGDPIAFVMYSGSYAFVLTLFAVLAWRGYSMRGAQLPEIVRVPSLEYAVHMTVAALCFILLSASVAIFGSVAISQGWLVVAVLPVLGYRIYRFARRRSAVSSPSI